MSSLCSRWRIPGTTCCTPSDRILRALGPRLGKQVNAVRDALAELDPGEVAALVRTGGDIQSRHRRGRSDSSTKRHSGRHGSTPRDTRPRRVPRSTVVLDTTLTPALIEEGLARDFVRGIQDARKQAGYQIDDTIEIRYVADPEVSRAIDAHRDVCDDRNTGDVARWRSNSLEPLTPSSQKRWKAQAERARSTAGMTIKSSSESTTFGLRSAELQTRSRKHHCAKTAIVGSSGRRVILSVVGQTRIRSVSSTCTVASTRLSAGARLTRPHLRVGPDSTAADCRPHSPSEDAR